MLRYSYLMDFYYFVICKCMSTTVHVNGTVILFLIMWLNVTIVTSCDSLFVIFSSLKLENGLKKHVQNSTEITYGFIKLVVIFYFLEDVINPFPRYSQLFLKTNILVISYKYQGNNFCIIFKIFFFFPLFVFLYSQWKTYPRKSVNEFTYL